MARCSQGSQSFGSGRNSNVCPGFSWQMELWLSPVMVLVWIDGCQKDQGRSACNREVGGGLGDAQPSRMRMACPLRSDLNP